MGARKELRRTMAAGYRRAKKKGRGQTLDEFCGLTGYNRCNAGLLLRNFRTRSIRKNQCFSRTPKIILLKLSPESRLPHLLKVAHNFSNALAPLCDC